jgi:mRNA interferase RelE/StbE
MRELSGLRKFKVKRFRIVYQLNRKARMIKIFAVGHRREVYEELADRLRETARPVTKSTRRPPRPSST